MSRINRKQRKPIPLEPNRQVWCAEGARVRAIKPSLIRPENIGLKAWGLLSIPAEWTAPFFLVTGDQLPTDAALTNAAAKAGVNSASKLFLRSSGTAETVETRGQLESAECNLSTLVNVLKSLKKKISSSVDKVHWIVQPMIKVHAQGHLSNERRLCRVHRDWEVEFEAWRGQPPENYRIALRNWRDDQAGVLPQQLMCPYRANCVDLLKVVAKWAYERLLRLHFEWVWDGQTLYVVQADSCNETTGGVQPSDLVHIQHGNVDPSGLEVFRIANADDFRTYRKLANVATYAKLGYRPVPFYVLDDSKVIESLLRESECPPNLHRDLERLCKCPLVIRTNGQGDMLPRSDELRSADQARSWLTEQFAEKLRSHPQASSDLCLVAHNFVPAQASAWCLARPGERRVRIESLWGIPEGLYWYAHDVFDVDTKVAKISASSKAPQNLRVNERLRYKGVFVAPNAAGQWVLHSTAAGPDWQRSIRTKRWIEKIAWDTRRISEEEGHPVVVMWFIRVPPEISSDVVMPWFHQEWKNDDASPRAAPRKKRTGASEHIIRTHEEWDTLVAKSKGPLIIERVIVDPKDTQLIRDPDFAEALGKLGKEKDFVIELAGGVLSHAYYLLARTGCRVECADLYATDDVNLEFNKLVRDRIPHGIEAQGESVKVVSLKSEALIEGLKRKLIEEAFEVADAPSAPQITEELADLYEIAAALVERLGIDEADIKTARSKKAKVRGKFGSGVMLVSTSLKPSITADKSDTADESLSSSRRLPSEISRAEELPIEHYEVNVDRRRDSAGTREAQITFTIPVYLHGSVPGMPSVTLETPAGEPHEMKLELVVERHGSEIRCRFHLRNQPSQLVLPLVKSK